MPAFRLTLATAAQLAVLLAAARPCWAVDEVATKYVDASWKEARQASSMLVARDVLLSFSEAAAALRTGESGLALQESRRSLLNALASIQDPGGTPDVRQLETALRSYEHAVADRYRTAWRTTNLILSEEHTPVLLRGIVDKLGSRCAAGASLPGEDFLTAPRPALPSYNAGFWVNTSFGDSGNVTGASVDTPVQGDKYKTAKSITYALALAGCSFFTGGTDGSVACGLVASGVVAIVFALLDLNDQNERKEALADSEAYRLTKRAVASDVKKLYVEQCGRVHAALQRIPTVLEAGPEAQNETLATVASPAFIARMQLYNTNAENEAKARCRIRLADALRRNECPAAGSPVKQPTFVVDPSCIQLDARGTAFECPKIISDSDSGCRRSGDGKLTAILLQWLTPTELREVKGEPECSVAMSSGGVYDVTADKALLTALGAARETEGVSLQQVQDSSDWIVAQAILALRDAEGQRRLAIAAEEELDRQQAYALATVLRLLAQTRIRIEILRLGESVETPASVRQVAKRLGRMDALLVATRLPVAVADRRAAESRGDALLRPPTGASPREWAELARLRAMWERYRELGK